MKYRTGGMHDMGRRPGSKNKPKINKVKPVEDNTLFHWNETIQKLNQMKEKGDWTQEPIFIDTVPKELCIDTESTTSTEAQPDPEPEPEPEPESKELKKGRKPATDKYNHCERCGAVVKCEPFRADLNVLTGRADYHRQSPRYIKLCSKCSMELSNLVDKWFIDGGGKSKFDRE